MTTSTATLPILIEEVEVVSVERLSPSFVRFELASPGLAELGVDGGWWDQRIKLVFPHEDGLVPSFAGADESWYATWLDRPVAERGHMRTYTVREVRGSGAGTRLVVDIVVHDGETGPAGGWALRAGVGDRLVLLAPRRGHAYGGIEFVPGAARELLLVGDETAVPAVAAILEQLEQLQPDARGTAFLEVPEAADVLDLRHPANVRVVWLPRAGGPRGETMHAAVLDHLGAAVRPPVDAAGAAVAAIGDDEVEDLLWETPGFSSSGEEIADAARPVGHDWDGLYAWIAGECKVVTALRRALVSDLGIDRAQVAFMGYWRLGVAMKS